MIATALPLDRFEPVLLEDIVAEAELLTRTDRKYVVSAERAGEILRELGAECRILTIDGQRDFGYESVYFDTPDHLS